MVEWPTALEGCIGGYYGSRRWCHSQSGDLVRAACVLQRRVIAGGWAAETLAARRHDTGLACCGDYRCQRCVAALAALVCRSRSGGGGRNGAGA